MSSKEKQMRYDEEAVSSSSPKTKSRDPGALAERYFALKAKSNGISLFKLTQNPEIVKAAMKELADICEQQGIGISDNVNLCQFLRTQAEHLHIDSKTGMAKVPAATDHDFRMLYGKLGIINPERQRYIQDSYFQEIRTIAMPVAEEMQRTGSI